MVQGIASFMGGSTREQQLRQQSKEKLLNTKTPIQKRRERRAGLKGGEGADSGIGKFATQLTLGAAPGAGYADMLGVFPDVEGGYEPSMLVNLQQAKRSFQEGNYKQAAAQGIFGALQGLGGAADTTLASAPFLGPAAPIAVKVGVGGKVLSSVGKKLVQKFIPKKINLPEIGNKINEQKQRGLSATVGISDMKGDYVVKGKEMKNVRYSDYKLEESEADKIMQEARKKHKSVTDKEGNQKPGVDLDEFNVGKFDGITMYTRNIVVKPEELKGIKGYQGEEKRVKTPSGEDSQKLKDLKESIAKEGYKPYSNPNIIVNHKGEPFVLEGNHRIQEAIDSGRPTIAVDIQYLTTGYRADGPLNPQKLIDENPLTEADLVQHQKLYDEFNFAGKKMQAKEQARYEKEKGIASLPKEPFNKIFIKGPFDRLIASGKKTLETRGNRLPEKYIGKPLVMKNEKNEAVGEVTFKGSRKIETKEEFDSLRNQHLVEEGSPFDFGNRKQTYVWEVDNVKKYSEPQKIEPMKGQAPIQMQGAVKTQEGIAALPTEQGARKVKDRTRIGTTGQYIGAPQGLNSPQKLASLRRKIKGLAVEGAKGRYWYESSGKEILNAVGGDVAEADKIVQAIAITSPQTPVKANFDYALQAYAQHKAGQPIQTGRFPQAMSKKLQDLFDGKKWDGRKTDDFYNNLMIHIDPERAGPVTGDIWMVRAFGFDRDGPPAPQQYKFITNEIQKISKELGWKPHQTQAAVWVNAKARQENPLVKKRTMEKSLKKGFIEYKTNAKGKQEVVYKNKPEHMKLWFKESFDYTPTEAELQKAGFDYADALKNNLGQISWESIPHNTTNHLRGLEQSTPNIKAAYHTDLSKVFLDDNGRDIIAQRLGLVSPGDFEAPGYYQGIVNPGTQTEVVAVKGYKTGKINRIEKSQEDLIEAYAIARGILMKQESVAWHRPFYSATKKDSNGIELNIGRPFSIEEIDDYAKEISKITGNKQYNPISTPEGVRIINYNNKFDNKEFQGLINQATENFSKKLDKSTDVKVEYFSSQNGYLENDWKKDKNGQGYLQRLRKEGQSDLYRKVYDIIEELQPRIDDVDAKFRDEYGFELNEEINSGFRNRNLIDDGSVSVDVKTEKPIKKIEQKAFGGFVESSNYDHYRII